MFSLANIPVRKYEFEHPKTMELLHVLPPKLETVHVFNTVYTDETSTPKDLSGIMATILSNNEECVAITVENVMAWMDVDQLSALVGDFLGWMNNTKANDPN